jgi:hypothetical protein
MCSLVLDARSALLANKSHRPPRFRGARLVCRLPRYHGGWCVFGSGARGVFGSTPPIVDLWNYCYDPTRIAQLILRRLLPYGARGERAHKEDEENRKEAHQADEDKDGKDEEGRRLSRRRCR